MASRREENKTSMGGTVSRLGPGRKKTRLTQRGTRPRPMLRQRQVMKKYRWHDVKQDVTEYFD